MKKVLYLTALCLLFGINQVQAGILVNDRLEELKITKRLRLIEKELKQKEETLFFSQAEVDVETEKKVEELTNSYNFDVLISCKFKLRLLKHQA